MELMHSSLSAAQASSWLADQPYHCGSSVSTSSSTLASTRMRLVAAGLTARASFAAGQPHDFVGPHAGGGPAAQARRQAAAAGLRRAGNGGLGLAQGGFAHEGSHGQAVQFGGAAQAVFVLDAQAQIETLGNGGHIGPPCTASYRTPTATASTTPCRRAGHALPQTSLISRSRSSR